MNRSRPFLGIAEKSNCSMPNALPHELVLFVAASSETFTTHRAAGVGIQHSDAYRTASAIAKSAIVQSPETPGSLRSDLASQLVTHTSSCLCLGRTVSEWALRGWRRCG